MAIQAKISLNRNDVIGEVHDHLYGANLEHIGQTIYGGLWAEMLVDRKFAGHDKMYLGMSEGLEGQNPAYGIVIPWEAVNADYARVLFVHDNTTFYTGRQSQRITIREEDDRPHGIQQKGLYLQAGRKVQARLVLKGEGQTVEIRLGDQVWRIAGVANDWRTYEHIMTPSATDANGALSITVQDAGNLWIGCASLMPDDHLSGYRADVVAALREWEPTFLRWPGGNFVSAYHWLDGIGDRDRRPSYLDPAWNQWEPNDVGADEFIELCRLVGTEPILTVNMGNGTVEEAAAWVEYCNGDASTQYGAMRAANGHPEPYHVKTWFVGNEQFGNWQVGHCDAETYARLYLEFARAMRAVDPDLRLIAVGAPTDLYGHWNELVLKAAAAEMDEISIHYYSIRTEKWDEPPPGEALYLPKVAAAHEVAMMLDQTLDIVDRCSDPPVPVAFDEWNTYFSAKAPGYIEDYNIGDALYAGALLNACIQRCDRIQLSAVYNLINVMGNYMVTPLFTWRQVPATRGNYWIGMAGDYDRPPGVWKAPTTLVLELMTRYRGREGIRCETETPTMATPAAGNLPAYDELPVIDAAATLDRGADIVYLSIVNRDPEKEAELRISGFERRGDAEVYLVKGESTYAANTAENPRAVVIEKAIWKVDEDLLIVPAHSFVMVAMR